MRTNKEIDYIRNTIKEIVDDYLEDLYGELDERSEKHIYTRARIELLMMCAFNKGEQYGKGNTKADS